MALPLTTTSARLSAWLRPDRPREIPERVSRGDVQRKLHDDIGAFLATHDLDFNDHNLGIVKAHLSGDTDVSGKIDLLLRTQGGLTDSALAAIKKPEASGIDPDYIADVAHQLNLKLAECLRIVNASSASGDAYRTAMETLESGAASDPAGSVTRMIALTRCVVDLTREMEGQLDQARRETMRLRNNLQRARRDADLDHLTRLPNRRVFERSLDALPQGDGATEPNCVALCDIDDFKSINDKHGHETGDRVLRFVAKFLRTALGDAVKVTRYGGEEFACLFERTAVDDAHALLDRARAGLCQRSIASRDDGRPIGHVTFSVGLVRITGDPRVAVRQADDALYLAKRAGKNRIVVGAANDVVVPTA